MKNIGIGVGIGFGGGISWTAYWIARYISSVAVVNVSDTEQTVTATIAGAGFDPPYYKCPTCGAVIVDSGNEVCGEG